MQHCTLIFCVWNPFISECMFCQYQLWPAHVIWTVFLASRVSPPRSFSHGPVCRHDRLCAAAQSEGVVPAAVWTAHLWRVLGEMHRRCKRDALIIHKYDPRCHVWSEKSRWFSLSNGCFSHTITSVSGRLLSPGPTRRYVFSSVKDVGGEHWCWELRPQMRHINSRTGQPVSSSAKTKASLFMSCCLLPSPVTFLALSLLWSVARAEHSKAATTWQLLCDPSGGEPVSDEWWC